MNAALLHFTVDSVWGKSTWHGPKQTQRDFVNIVELISRSPDSDEDFPRDIEARVWYHIDRKFKGKTDVAD